VHRADQLSQARWVWQLCRDGITLSQFDLSKPWLADHSDAHKPLIVIAMLAGLSAVFARNAEWLPTDVAKISRARWRTKNRPSRICRLVAVIATDSQLLTRRD
jgi:hypothetical protein